MFIILSFYRFIPLTDAQITELQSAIEEQFNESNAGGLILLAPEGFNVTVAVPNYERMNFLKIFNALPGFESVVIKESFAEKIPFRKFKIDRRDEIITLKNRPLNEHEIRECTSNSSIVSPSEWNELIESEDAIILDTRNKYESDLGYFRNAIRPDIKKFTELSEYLRNSSIPKDKKLLIYCTGGVRCEKLYLDMKAMGYQEVFQLEGGILNYLEEYPNEHYIGECFVFDHRVALDQKLQPSKKFKLCPLCGDPSERIGICAHCGTESTMCEKCFTLHSVSACSKNCNYHLTHKNFQQA